MRFDEIKYSLKNLASRKMRSWLTLLSILIGLLAISSLLSFGLGIQNYMSVLGDDIGTDKLYIQPKGVGAPGTDENFFISDQEIDFVSKIKGIEEITAWYMKPALIKSDGVSKYSFLAGLDTELRTEFMDELFTVTILKGRHLKKGDVTKVALGYNYQLDNKIFKKALELGQKVEINGEKFDIVGFYEQIGNPGDDANIYVSYEGYEKLYPDSKDKFAAVMISAASDVKPKELADKIEDKLRKYKGQDEGKEDFYVSTLEDALEIFNNIFGVINAVLVLIALISVVVASVNIMNTMYTAVLERTGEIGIMKAVGAKNSDIFFIFIFESGFLGLVGGGAGMLLGYFISYMGGVMAASAGLTMLRPHFPIGLTIACLSFSFFVGAVAGFFPALQAAKQKPVDALRYE